jgi:hypothetical protein
MLLPTLRCPVCQQQILYVPILQEMSKHITFFSGGGGGGEGVREETKTYQIGPEQ